jgi:hypothetical protein
VAQVLQFTEFYDHKANRSLRVLSHGRTSGWTCGSLNELRSDIRQVYLGYPEFVTTEWCVINIPGLNNFSYHGDSGSTVIDFEGKIIGLIHSGNGQREHFSAEITYVTPMQWIIDDIKTTLHTDVIIERNPDE